MSRHSFHVVKAPSRKFREGTQHYAITWDDPESDLFQIFLAGSIDMGRAANWQKMVELGLQHRPVRILSPRRDDFDPTLEQDISNPAFREQVDWEMDALKAADIILFYFEPEGQAPVTLLELGMMAERANWRGDHTIFVCCPKGYWRRGNVQIVCDRYKIEMVEDLDALIARANQHLDEVLY